MVIKSKKLRTKNLTNISYRLKNVKMSDRLKY